MNKNKSQQSRHASTAIAAAMAVVPMLGMASPEAKPAKVESSTQVTTAPSQRSDLHWKFKSSFEKLKGEYWIAGVGDGHAIYKNARGEYFYVEPATGVAERNARVIGGEVPALNDAALRTVARLPTLATLPAQLRGQPVRVYYVLSIGFASE